MRYSAALLVKQSAAQLNYHFRKAQKAGKGMVVPDAFEYIPTKEQKDGNKWADDQTVSDFKEMRGQFTYDGDTIYFCIDEIQVLKNRLKFIEHKKPPGDPKQKWYRENSIIQVAFYQSLLLYADSKLLVPSSFSSAISPISTRNFKITWILNCGGDKYRITVKDHLKIMRFFLTKLRASRDYNTSKRFDQSWKHKEWQGWFKELVRYRKL